MLYDIVCRMAVCNTCTSVDEMYAMMWHHLVQRRGGDDLEKVMCMEFSLKRCNVTSWGVSGDLQ